MAGIIFVVSFVDITWKGRATMRVLLSIVQGIHIRRRTVSIGIFAVTVSYTIFEVTFVDIVWKDVCAFYKETIISNRSRKNAMRRTVSIGFFAFAMLGTIFPVSFVDIAWNGVCARVPQSGYYCQSFKK